MTNDAGIVTKYFPTLTRERMDIYDKLFPLYKYWNERINVISAKDADNLYERHVLHSLSIAEIVKFKPGAEILDVGTGGGFPAIPLAIMFPEASFTAVDSIGKKIKVVKEIIRETGLKNIKAEQIRAEEVKGKFDFVLGRAVSRLADFTGRVIKRVKPGGVHVLPNGVICLKGGELKEEIDETIKLFKLQKSQVSEYLISEFFEEEFFETKKIIYLQPRLQ